MSAHTCGNDDATAELANEPRADPRQRICRLHHGDNGDGPGLPLQQKLLLHAVDQQPGIGIAEQAPNREITASTMSGDVRNAETAGFAKRVVAAPKVGRGSTLALAVKNAKLNNDLKQRRRDWPASKIDQLRANEAGTFGRACRYLDEIGK